ncbi:glycosyltransferase [Haladaptatus sp. GCM10025707]|uniref:glycosyltransferase n=1 Tax=Haladaptatus sp. GCM10025707 TaxID=3252658 RepID=UPI003622EBA3
MKLSVVIPTLNDRERLARTLDSLSEHAPDAERIVVNGPSTDGTTGMIRERDDVTRLIELADRNLNVARNAGAVRADGDAIAFISSDRAIEAGWFEAVIAGLEDADAVTGPTHRELTTGLASEVLESRSIAGREVTYVNGSNAAFHRDVFEALDGFDEYLQTGGARDLSHRLASNDYQVGWAGKMCVHRGLEADGGRRERDWAWKYRALTYRLVKNYGIRPTVARRTLSHGGADALDTLRDVARGNATPSGWVGSGRDVLRGMARGTADGIFSRRKDKSGRRNPNGMSSRADRAVEVYTWR